ncbi:hypothetical protein [Salinarimonas ramus]|uniref:Uncharacterized protein n=1 Tax=Salinarimonas ramus TaxID=690164 RepID=A0A917QEZ5_9HYPH|nr:hypothetical protein [Salinarimonas ramus]GGK47462.1 hypothetical protein GCM10011322_38150 [Salinarimonas ramus]
MKIPSLIVDAHGRVHLAASRAPDLVRRAVAAETGAAHLIGLALPPPGISARAFVEDLAERLGGEKLADGTWLLAGDAADARRAFLRAAAGEDRLASAKRWMKKLVRRLRHAMRRIAAAPVSTPPASTASAPSPSAHAPRL